MKITARMIQGKEGSQIGSRDYRSIGRTKERKGDGQCTKTGVARTDQSPATAGGWRKFGRTRVGGKPEGDADRSGEEGCEGGEETEESVYGGAGGLGVRRAVVLRLWLGWMREEWAEEEGVPGGGQTAGLEC